MTISSIELLDESTDNEGRLKQVFKVIADRNSDPPENVESIKTSYTEDGQQLPQKGDVNPHLDKLTDPNIQTYLDGIDVSRGGKNELVFKVNCQWVRADEFASRQEDIETQVPWLKRPDYSETGDTIDQLVYTDADGKPAKFSNGEAMGFTRPMPVSIIRISRARLYQDSPKSTDLRKQFYQKVNDGPVTILGTTYADQTLLCQAFDTVLEDFEQVDDNGVETRTDYFTEDIVLVHNELTWDLNFLDQGNYRFIEVLDNTQDPPESFNPPKFVPFDQHTDPDSGISVVKVYSLNGRGKPLFNEDYEESSGRPTIAFGYGGETETGFGTPINTDLSTNINGVYLRIKPYLKESFAGMNLNAGFDI